MKCTLIGCNENVTLQLDPPALPLLSPHSIRRSLARNLSDSQTKLKIKSGSGGNNYNYNSGFGSRHIECEPKGKTCIDAPPVLASPSLSLSSSRARRSALSAFIFLSRLALFCTYALRFNSFLLVFRFRRLGIVRSVVRAKRCCCCAQGGVGGWRCRSMNNERQCKAKSATEGERRGQTRASETRTRQKKSKAKVHEKQWARERRGGKRYNFFPCWQPKAKHGGERERARRGGPPSRI